MTIRFLAAIKHYNNYIHHYINNSAVPLHIIADLTLISCINKMNHNSVIYTRRFD